MPVFCLLLNFPDNAFIRSVRKGIWKRAQSSLRNGKSGGGCQLSPRLIAASFRKKTGRKKDWIALGNNKWVSSTTPRDLESTMACVLEHESLQSICKKLIILRIIYILLWGQALPPTPSFALHCLAQGEGGRSSSRQNQLRHLSSCSIICKAREKLFVFC